MKKFIFLAVAVALLSITASESKASLQLMLKSGATTITVVDGGGGDLNGVADGITFVGAVGNFKLNVTTGLSNGVLGINQMDLNSIDTSSNPGGVLEIKLTDDGFTAPAYKLDIGGTTQGMVKAWLYEGTNGTPFSQAHLLGALGTFSGGAFSGSKKVATSGLPHQITMAVRISHGTKTKTSSFDFGITPIPEPATAAMFGFGMLGMIGYAVRRRRTA